MLPKRSAVITADYVAQYVDPIDVAAGAVVHVQREDADFPGWWWCSAGDARSGWVPAPLLDPPPAAGTLARVQRDYSARELSVRRGEHVSILDEHAGWLLVRSDAGTTGWIPATSAR